MSLAISGLPLYTVGSNDFVPVSRTGNNGRINFQDSVVSILFNNASYGGQGALDDGKVALYDDGGDLWAINIYLGDAITQHGTNTPGVVTFYDNSGKYLELKTNTLTSNGQVVLIPDSSGTILLEETYETYFDGVTATNIRVYRPESYGAAKDGSTNDRAAIQAAIDACYSAGGGIVQLSAGNYRVQESSGLAILLKTGVKLKGSGMDVTTISTDNATSSNQYCLIAPYNYNTVTSPYSAHELDIEDLTLTGTQYSSSASNDNLHDLIGIAHCPKARITRVGFDTSRYHFAEINCSKNVIFTDCAVVGNGNRGTGGSKFQIDNNGSCGQKSANARYSTSIVSAGTYASGTQTLLTVSSTTGFQVGDFVVITSATGLSAATYNRVGGFKVTKIVSSTEMAISVAYPGNTTTGTIKAEIPIDGVKWLRFIDKAPSDASVDQSREFLELSHTNSYGIIRNITVEECTIVPATFTFTIPGGRPVISFDSSAYPMEFTNFKFINNIIKDGGHTGLTILLNLYMGYDSNYPYRRMSNIEISGNRVQNCGLIHFLVIGQTDDDTTARTSVSTNITQVTDKVFVKNNLIEVALKGSAATAARPTRLFRIGSMNSAVVEGNRVYVPDIAPYNLFGLSWTLSVTSNYAFFFDHVRNLTVRDNTVEVYLTPENAYMYLHGFVFAVGAFEVAGIESYQYWVNNNVLGLGSIGDNISHTFIELGNSSIQYSNWLNPRNPYCKGRWAGNRGSSAGTRPGDTWSIYSDNHNTPCQVITSSPTTSGNANIYGRHDWWDGTPVYQTFNNTAIVVDSLTTHLIQTGTMSASRAITMPYSNLGRSLYIIDQNGTVTGANTLVPTRVGTDLINNATTITGSGAYTQILLIPNRVSGWLAK